MAAAEGRVIHFEGGRSYKLRSTGGYLKKKKKQQVEKDREADSPPGVPKRRQSG